MRVWPPAHILRFSVIIFLSLSLSLSLLPPLSLSPLQSSFPFSLSLSLSLQVTSRSRKPWSPTRRHRATQVRWHSLLIQICNCTHSYVLYNWSICSISLIHICVGYSGGTARPFIFVNWLIHMCDTTCSYVQHHSSTRAGFSHGTACYSTHSLMFVTWLIHVCDLIYTYVQHHSSIYVRLTQVALLTHSYS